jgi:dihydrofolate synthase/folylpolyglutamate synthase
MNYSESLDYVFHAKKAGAEKCGLANISELLKRLGNPEARFPSVHVAGTNGKGSVCAFIESILRASGYKTGLYTSPYLERFTERIRVGAEEISEVEFAALATRVRIAADEMVREGFTHPTFFELVTACGFMHFAERNVDIAVIEAGLGGRTDATNVLQPLVSVITTIGIDHAHALGGTIERIAGEKAGIIKPGVPCVLSGANDRVAADVIREAAARAGSLLVRGSEYRLMTVYDNLEGQGFNLSGEGLTLDNLEISLLGSHQTANAATAILAVLELRKQGYGTPDGALRTGLKNTCWPGRMELLRREPPVLIDGAHNPQAAEALASGVLKYLGGRPVCLVTGAMADKDAGRMAESFSRFSSKVIATMPPAEGRLRHSAGDLAEIFLKLGVHATANLDWRQALEEALGSGMAVVVAGSIYLAGAARTWLREQLPPQSTF